MTNCEIRSELTALGTLSEKLTAYGKALGRLLDEDCPVGKLAEQNLKLARELRQRIVDFVTKV